MDVAGYRVQVKQSGRVQARFLEGAGRIEGGCREGAGRVEGGCRPDF